MQYLLDRLREKSTWAGMLTLAATVAGVHVAPEQAEAIATLGVAVASAVCVFTKAKG